MKKHCQLVGDDWDRVRLLRHVVGHPLGIVGDPLHGVEEPLACCPKNAFSRLKLKNKQINSLCSWLDFNGAIT